MTCAVAARIQLHLVVHRLGSPEQRPQDPDEKPTGMDRRDVSSADWKNGKSCLFRQHAPHFVHM